MNRCNKIKYLRRLFIGLFIGTIQFLSAQEIVDLPTVVVGQVMDKYSQMPLANVDIYFKGGTRGVRSNAEGYFLIRNEEKRKTLIFSLIGYKTLSFRIKPTESSGVQVEMEEKITILNELFVFSNTSIADALMKKVRKSKRENAVPFANNRKEEQIVFLSKKTQDRHNGYFFKKLHQSNLSPTDSLLLVPLLMDETTTTDGVVEHNSYNTSKTTEELLNYLLKGVEAEQNFYQNAVLIMGRKIISPLANVGANFYKYYITDSLNVKERKQYVVAFRSKNSKNLAFNGTMHIDSATYALTHIDAILPNSANINYIHHLALSQQYVWKGTHYFPKKSTALWNLSYQIYPDSTANPSEVVINKSVEFQSVVGEDIRRNVDFANSGYQRDTLKNRLALLQNTPLFKTARWIADATLTGYANVGYFDLGKIVNVARLTEQEGLRLGLPLHTNERISKYWWIGGYGAYGFGDKKWKYGINTAWKLPTQHRKVITVGYYDDYKRTDYDELDIDWREDALTSGDDDIVNTILSLQTARSLSRRNSLYLSFENQWNKTFTSLLRYQNSLFFSNKSMPMVQQNRSYNNFRTQSITLINRVAFDERVMTDHLRQISFLGKYPVLYGILQVGKSKIATTTHHYTRIAFTARQQQSFLFGEWHYRFTMGKIMGAVPYPLLHFFNGNENGGYGRNQFTLMNYNEYATDSYVSLHTELLLNGILFNYIPLIKHLNLREMFSLKMAYGTLNSKHQELLNLPGTTNIMKHPYTELGVGIANILGFVTVQSVWRLTDLHHSNVRPWGLAVCLIFGF